MAGTMADPSLYMAAPVSNAAQQRLRRKNLSLIGYIKMFTEPDVPERVALQAQLNLLQDGANLGLRTPGNSNLRPQDRPINKDDIYDPIRANFSRGLMPTTISKYLQMICHYVNESATPQRHGVNDIPICAHMSYNWFARRRAAGETYGSGGALQLGWLCNELDAGGLTRTRFLNQITPIQYIFIPVNVQYQSGTDHSTLLVISPRNQTIEYFDSDRGRFADKIEDIMVILAHHLGASFHPYEWKIRTDYGFDQGVNEVNCALHTTATAMVIAFGYQVYATSTNYARANVRARRRRLATELMNGRFDRWDPPPPGNPDPPGGPHAPFVYPLNDLRGDVERVLPGFRKLDANIFRKLPRDVRARSGRYWYYDTKADLLRHCKAEGRRRRYRGCVAASRAPNSLDDFKRWMELRDEDIRTHHFVI